VCSILVPKHKMLAAKMQNSRCPNYSQQTSIYVHRLSFTLSMKFGSIVAIKGQNLGLNLFFSFPSNFNCNELLLKPRKEPLCPCQYLTVLRVLKEMLNLDECCWEGSVMRHYCSFAGCCLVTRGLEWCLNEGFV